MAMQTGKRAEIDVEPLLKPTEFTSNTLRGLIKAAEISGFRLVDWERQGVPRVDKVVVTAVGPTSGVGEMLQAVFKVPQLKPNVHVLPRGIPAFDEIQAEITAVVGT